MSIRKIWDAMTASRRSKLKSPNDGIELAQPSGSAQDVDFERMVAEARVIRQRFIDPNRDWYRTHRLFPFLLFRFAGVTTIVLGAALPAIAGIPVEKFASKDLVISVMSVSIAALTGLSTFFRWERTWRGRTLSDAAINALCAKWELEIVNARLIVDPPQRLKHVYLATSDLIANARAVSASESEEFFNALQFPQTDRTSPRSDNATGRT